MKHIQYIISVFLIIASNKLLAQDTLYLTLEKARAIALSNNPEIKSKETDVLIAQENLALEKIKKYPTVFGDANLQRNLIIPVTPVPAKAFNPNAPDNEIMPLQFTTKWTGNAGINASYDVFNPNSRNETKIKNIQIEIAKTDNEIIKNDAMFSVGNAYITAIIAQEQLHLNVAETVSKTKTLKMFQEQYNEGRITLIQFNESIADLNASKAREAEAKSISEKANAQLLFELGYNPEIPLKIIFEENIETIFAEKSFSDTEKTQSLSLKKIEQQKDILSFQLDKERFRNLPTFTLGGYLGTSYFNNNFDIFKEQNYHGNSYIKAGLKIPLTDWVSTKRNKAIINHQFQSNELAYQAQKNKNSLSYIQAKKDVEAAYEKYVHLKENFELSQKNNDLIKQQYSEGRILISELYKTDYAVQKAKNDYLNAAYDYITAQLKLENEQRK